MKKFISGCCMVMLIPLLSACGDKTPSYQITDPGTWTDGTYTHVSRGYRSDLAVTVTIDGGKMTEIEVAKNDETPDRGGKAIEEMPQAMIEAQTHEVDGISSATRTSDALKDAVAQSLEEASGNTEN